MSDHDPKPGAPERRHRRDEKARDKREQEKLEDELNEELEDSFPASDPPSITRTTTPGGPKK